MVGSIERVEAIKEAGYRAVDHWGVDRYQIKLRFLCFDEFPRGLFGQDLFL